LPSPADDDDDDDRQRKRNKINSGKNVVVVAIALTFLLSSGVPCQQVRKAMVKNGRSCLLFSSFLRHQVRRNIRCRNHFPDTFFASSASPTTTTTTTAPMEMQKE